MRSGIIAKKVGMTRLFLEDGKQVPVTVLQLDNLQVVAQRTSDKDGYTAVQLDEDQRVDGEDEPCRARPEFGEYMRASRGDDRPPFSVKRRERPGEWPAV